MASPLTVYSSAADGMLQGNHAAYATARTTGGTITLDNSTAIGIVGQRYATTYFCWETFYSWDTSTLPAGCTIDSATISIYLQDDQTDTDFTANIRACDWGTSLAAGDWVSGASLSALTLLASKSTVGIAVNAYTVFTSEAALLTNINRSGETRVVVCSSRHEAGDTPTGIERFRPYTVEKGTTYRPRLVVNYTEAATGCPKMTDHYARLRRG